MTRPIPYRDTWTAVPGQSERTYRVRQAHREPVRMAVPDSRQPIDRWSRRIYRIATAVVGITAVLVIGFVLLTMGAPVR